jgi:hypothetical protein
MTRCAGVARRKENIRKNQPRYNVEQGVCKEWRFRKRHCMKPKGSHGVKNQDVKEQWEKDWAGDPEAKCITCIVLKYNQKI